MRSHAFSYLRSMRGLFAAGLRRLGQVFAGTTRPPPTRGRPGLADLMPLEDRRLLSVSPVGSEFRINTFTSGTQQTFQQENCVAMAPNGNFVAAWTSQNQDGSGWGIYAQRYDSYGNPLGSEFQVNTHTQNDQTNPSVAMDGSGNFVVAWQSNNQDGSGWGVYAQRYDASGNPLGSEFQVNTYTNNDQNYPAVAMDATGAFVITWQSNNQDGNGLGIYGQRYNASGVAQGSEFRINTTTQDNQQFPSVAMDGSGSFVVTWLSHNQDGSGWGVYAQRYDALGNPLGSEFQVNTYTNNDQEYPVVAMDASGAFVITWQSNNQDGSGWGVYGQCYNAAGVAQGSEFRINTTTQDNQQFPSVAMDGSGSFVVVWQSHNQDGNGWGIFGQRYDALGNPLGGEFQINTTTAGNQLNATVAADSRSDFVVVWSGSGTGDGAGVFGQRYESTGINVSPTSGLVTTMSGGTATFQVALNNQPTANVTIGLHSSDTSEGTLSTSSLTFTPANWNTPQTVTVTGVNNLQVSGDQQYTIITDPASSTDPNYSGLDAADVVVTNVDTNVPGFTITPNAGLVTTEAGGTASFSVRLNTAPLILSSVTVSFTSSSPSEGVVSTSPLTFSWTNWNVPQTVTVTGVDDHVADGNTTYTITGQASSLLALNYNGLSTPPITFTSVDTDVAGIQVTPVTGLTTTEAGGQASFTVQLTSKPLATVTINLAPSVSGQGSLAQTSLSFNATNWNVAQTVTVTGLDDHIVNGDQTYQINLTGSSSDSSYDGMQTAVNVTNQERDQAGIDVTGSTFLVAVDNSVLRVNSLTGATVATYPTGVPNNGVTVGPDGSFYVADYYGNQILHYDATGAFLSSFGSGQLTNPQGLSFGPDGNLYVTDTTSTVQEYSPTGTFLGTFISAGSGGLNNAKAIVWGPDGNAYVSSFSNSEVLQYNGTTGAFMKAFASGGGGFEDLTFGPDGNLYVASYGNNAIYRYRGTDGAFLGTFVSGITTPFGLRFDPTGNLDVSSRSTGQILTYQGSTGALLGTLATGLVNPAFIIATTSLVTSESGTSASFGIALNSQPTADVTITLASTMPGQGSLSQSSLTFTPANWNVVQTVTVTGLPDYKLDGDQTYQINGTAASSDPIYNGLTISPIVVVNKETEVAGLVVTPTTLQTSESGTTAAFTVSLTVQPNAPVTVNLSNGNPGQGSLSQTSLTFTSANWNVAQSVTVTGLDDHLINGNQTYQVTGTTTSSDANFNNLTMTPVTVTNTEADVAGFTVTPPALTTAESGTTAAFSVALTSKPVAPVTVNLSMSVSGQGALSQTSLTFNPGNWNVAQTVTVTGLDDYLVNGDQTYQITLTGASSDSNYNGLQTAVSVTNQERDQAGVSVTPIAGLTTSGSGATATFQVVLTSKPVATVTIGLSSSKPTEGVPNVSSLTFTAANWNVPQTVTVTGVDDHIVDGPQPYTIITAPAVSADPNYSGFNAPDVQLINLDNDVASVSITQDVGPGGNEFQVNTTTAGNQQTSPSSQAVAVDGSNNSVVVWASQGQDGSGWGVYARRFDPFGNPLTGEVQVNTTTAGDQMTPAVGVRNNGDFTVAWASQNQDGSGWGIFARVFDSSGNPLTGEIAVNTTTAGDQITPSVAARPNGNFVITWASQNQDGSGWGIFARVFDSSGNPLTGEIPVNTTTAGDQMAPAAAMQSNGDFAITWQSNNQDGSGWGVYSRVFNASGTPLTGEIPVNTTTAGDQLSPAIAMGNGGNFVVSWASQGQDGSGWGVYAQQFSAGGVPQGGEFQVNTTTTNDQQSPAVAMDGTGNFLITWASFGQDVRGSWGVYGQRYDAAGNPLDSEFRVNATTANDQLNPAVAAGSTGNFVAVWSSQNQDGSGYGVYGQVYNAVGYPISRLVTTEAGGVAHFTVVLTSQPLAPVMINLTNPRPDQGALSATSLTFTAANWNIPQVVTVTGLDDGLLNGDVTYTIVPSVVSADPFYNGTGILDVLVTNQETDLLGFVVTPTAGLVTSENGGTASFTVQLASPPLGNVTVPVVSSNTAEGVPSTSSLTFTPLNWNTPQTVTVTGVDDFVADGNQPYQILLGPASSPLDPTYNHRPLPDVSLINLDNDVAGIRVTPTTGLTLNGADGSATFAVVLTSMPTADVTIGLSSSDSAAGTAGQVSLTFTPADWNTPQTVTVQATPGVLPAGSTTFTIVTATANSADPNYNSLNPADVTLTRIDSASGTTSSPAPGPTGQPAGNTSAPPAQDAGQNSPAQVTAVTPSTPGPASTTLDATPSNGTVGTTSVLQPGSAVVSISFTLREAAQLDAPPAAQYGSVLSALPTSPGAVLQSDSPIAQNPGTPGPFANFFAGNGNYALGGVAVARTGGSAPWVSTLPVDSADVQMLTQASLPWTVGMLAFQGNPGPVTALYSQGGPLGMPQSSLETLLPVLESSTESAAAEVTQTAPSAGGAQVVRRSAYGPVPSWEALDRMEEQIDTAEVGSGTGPVVMTGLAATAGYVLLNTRAGPWLLSLLVARPLWRHLDPLEVLFAWEENERRTENDEEESLLSLVE